MTQRDYIAVLDFGGQYAHLIAKRIRHLGVFTRVVSPTSPKVDLQDATGIILSGGPQSVFGADAVPFNQDILSLDKPVLGLCYGHQLLAQLKGGQVSSLGHGEYGKTRVALTPGTTHPLLKNIDQENEVWMSHGDTVESPPPEYEVLGATELCPVAIMAHKSLPVYGVQFHPEVTDTPCGITLLENFVKLTGVRKGWNMQAYLEEVMEESRQQVGDRNVLMFLSGGVDSTVAFALLTRALGSEQVRGLLIDNAFLRKDEATGILRRYEDLGLGHVDFLDASQTFLSAVAGKVDPQEKRMAVGDTFMQVREEYLAKMNLDPDHWLLGQGTLYPDIIESGGSDHAEVIKFHHNRVESVQALIDTGHVVEPLKELYKDEVRALGETMGLPKNLVWRHPFPGPGLSINVLCSEEEGGDATKDAFPEIAAARPALQALLAQSPFTGDLLPVRSVGVQGDSRTYTPPAVLTGPRDWAALEDWSIRITNKMRGINRVVTLLTPEALPPLHARRAFCTKDRLDTLREADHLANQMLEANNLMREIFQLLVILLPLSHNGQGDSLVLRPVISEDVMTARFAPIRWELVLPLAQNLLSLPGISAVFYDVTHKPPATFGWE